MKPIRVELGCTVSRPTVTATVACTARTLAALAAPDALNVPSGSSQIEAGQRLARPAILARSSTRRGAASVWRAPQVKHRIHRGLQPAFRARLASCSQCQDPAHAENAGPEVSLGRTGPSSACNVTQACINPTTGPQHAGCALLARSRRGVQLLCVSAAH